MATSRDNIITHGLSGKVGDIIVFSQRNGKTIVGKAPKQSTKEATEAQKAHQDKFQQATIYGKAVITDPITKELYEAKGGNGVTAYNVAVADLLQAPDIEKIDLSQYNGIVGDKISITVTDDFKVTAVQVSIFNPDDSLVEEGAAVQNGLTSEWIYTATSANTLPGDKIIIKASDLAGNITKEEQVLS